MTTRSFYAYSLPRLLTRSSLLRTTKLPPESLLRTPRIPRRTPIRGFHTTRVLLLDDHYATLELQPGAAASDIKKAFYRLSKLHHPDRNPENKEQASDRFSAISDAYHVLGDEKRREKYDQQLNQARGGGGGSGGGRSYSSAGGGSGPGSRKASGLSRRRGTFRGPPPSFYRSGGWGPNQDKRRANQGADPREAEARRQQQQAAGSSGPHAGKTGDWPFATDPNDVGHFDREGHFKTTSSVEEQLRKGRTKRRNVFSTSDDMMDDESSLAVLAKFLQVTGIIAVGIGGSVLLFGR